MYFLFPYPVLVYVLIPICPYIYPTNRQYPPTDQEILSQSVEEYQILMQQGEILLNKLADPSFAKPLMEEAQKGNQDEVNKLIEQIDGLVIDIDINYTPTGAIFELTSPQASEGGDCCTLNMILKWGM